jgi:hypothetical protein
MHIAMNTDMMGFAQDLTKSPLSPFTEMGNSLDQVVQQKTFRQVLLVEDNPINLKVGTFMLPDHHDI